MSKANNFRSFIFVGVILVLTAIVAWGIASYPLNFSNPVVLITLGGIGILLIIARPESGVLLLISAILLSPLYPLSPIITLNRSVGLLLLGVIFARQALHLDNFPIKFTVLDFLFAVYFLVVLISMLVNGAFTDSGQIQLWTMLVSFMLYWFTIHIVREPRQLRRLLWVFVGCMALLAFFSLDQALRDPDLRRYGGISFVNTVGSLSVVAITPALWLARETSLLKRMLLYVLVLLFIAAAVLSGSRGAVMMLAATFVLYFVLLPQSTAAWLRALIVSIAAFVLLLSLIGQLAPGPVERGIRDLAPQLQAVINPRSNAEADIRLKLMRISLALFQSRPVFGVGYGNFLPSARTIDHSIQVADHNLFTATLGETGLAGFLVLLLLEGYLILKLWRLRRIATSRQQVDAASFALMLFIVYNLVGALTLVLFVDRFVFIIFSIAAATAQIVERDSQVVEKQSDPARITANHLNRPR